MQENLNIEFKKIWKDEYLKNTGAFSSNNGVKSIWNSDK